MLSRFPFAILSVQSWRQSAAKEGAEPFGIEQLPAFIQNDLRHHQSQRRDDEQRDQHREAETLLVQADHIHHVSEQYKVYRQHQQRLVVALDPRAEGLRPDGDIRILILEVDELIV